MIQTLSDAVYAGNHGLLTMNISELFPRPTNESAAEAGKAPFGHLLQILESLDHDKASELASLYADDISYEDPNKALQGKKSMLAYVSTFLSDKSVAVRVHTTMEQDDSFFMSWSATVTEHMGSRSYSQRLEGASFFRAREGKIYFQRNYFDEAIK